MNSSCCIIEAIIYRIPVVLTFPGGFVSGVPRFHLAGLLFLLCTLPMIAREGCLVWGGGRIIPWVGVEPKMEVVAGLGAFWGRVSLFCP